MAIFNNSIIPAAAAAADDVVTKSLRFSGDAALTSPAFGTSSSDQKKKTLSFWVKRCELDDDGGQPIFEFINGSGTTDGGSMAFSGRGGGGSSVNDDFVINNRNASSGPSDYIIRTTGLFRDVAAFYHFCIKYDTTNATAADRIQIWVNGKRVTALNTGDTAYPPLNYVTTAFLAPSTAAHTMGYGIGTGSANYLGGYLADFYYIDGVANDATSFAEEDATTGQWKPKAYSGAMGDNGFHLPFDSEDGQVFALQSDAVDGNTTFTDLSQHTHAITRNGNTEHSTDVSDPAGGSKSSMYFAGTSDYLSSTDAKDVANFDNSDWTLEFWIRPSNTFGSVSEVFMGCGGGVAGWNATNGHSWSMFAYEAANEIWVQYWNGTYLTELKVNDDLIPANTWTHVALVNQSGTKRWYIGGIQRTTGTVAKAAISTPSTLNIGDSSALDAEFEGYIHNVSIQRDFCKYKDGTLFTPSTSPVTALSADIGFDSSSNGNHFDATNLDAATDVVNDTPTENYAVMNVLASTAAGTDSAVPSEGNLQLTFVGGGNSSYFVPSTIGFSSGKFYYEAYINNTYGAGANVGIGVANESANPNASLGGDTNSLYYLVGGDVYYDGAAVSYGGSWTTGAVLGVAVDADTGKVWYSVGGTWQGSPTAGTGAAVTLSGNTFFAAFRAYAYEFTANFGQDPFFAGGKTSGQDTSQSEFYYEPPSDFVALKASNLTATIKKPKEHFDTAIYTGNATDGRTNAATLEFQPDLVWIKRRSSAKDHGLYDSVRGTSNELESNSTTVEDTSPDQGYVSAFNATGFTLTEGGTDFSKVNGDSSNTYVAWSWKAGTSFEAESGVSGSGSKNPTAGFGISTWTGIGEMDGDTIDVAHGCGGTPELVIAKDRDSPYGQDWIVWHHKLSTDKFLILNDTSAEASWDSSYPLIQAGVTNNTFGLDSTTSGLSLNDGSNSMNGETTYVAYSMRSIEGYSKVGSYEGNNSADGPFVYCGFKPRWICCKRIDGTGSWIIIDTARDPYNDTDDTLAADTSLAESSYATTSDFDILSNGFKLRHNMTYGYVNQSDTYIFYAVAESPFKYANAR